MIENSRQPYERIAIWLILVVSAAIKFYNLGEMSLSNDELSSLIRIRYDSFSEMISKGVYIDFHPAGLQTFLFYWVKIFGDSPFAIRFPFVIFSLISTWLIYIIGRRWFNGLTGLLAASAFAFLTFPILFLQLARMYSPGVMFSLLTVYFWTSVVSGKGGKIDSKSWWGWIISMSACLHLHYFSFIFAGLVGLSGLFVIDKINFKKYFLGGLIALLTFIPEIPIFLAQMKTGDIGGWLPPPAKSFIIDFFFEFFNRSYLVCAVVILFFISGIILGKKTQGYNRWRLLSLSWFFFSFGIAFVYSLMGHPVIMYSTLLFSAPCLLLCIFSFVPGFLVRKNLQAITVLVFSLILIYDSIYAGRHFTVKYFGVFREVAEDAERWTKKYGRENVPLVTNVVDPGYIGYYFDRMEVKPWIVDERIDSALVFSRLKALTDTCRTPYFSFLWTNSNHPWEAIEIIRSSYPFLLERNAYFNAASYLFSKQPADSMINTLLYSSGCDFEKSFWSIDSSKVTAVRYHSSGHSQEMNMEFGTTFREKLSKVPGSGFRYMTFSAMIFPENELKSSQIVISFDHEGKPFFYFGRLLSEYGLIPGKWQEVMFSVEFPDKINTVDELSAYFWNPSVEKFYIDDLKIVVNSGVFPYERFTR